MVVPGDNAADGYTGGIEDADDDASLTVESSVSTVGPRNFERSLTAALSTN